MKRCLLAAMALAAAVACGGGSPTASSSYPAVKGTYGGYRSTDAGASQQRWTSPDGAVTTLQCWASTSISEQNGAQFSGTIDRLSPGTVESVRACVSQGTLAGTVAQDGSIRFTLAQARWGDCDVVPGALYTGRVGLGSLVAEGQVSLRCDDGRTIKVDERLSGATTIPPTTPG